MRLKEFTKCEECGKKIKSFRIYRGKYICFQCFQGESTIMPLNVFNEPLDVSTTLSVILTKSQDESLQKRLRLLFPTKWKKSKRPNLAGYIRELVLSDLKYCEEKWI